MMLGGVPALFRWAREHLFARIRLRTMGLFGDNNHIPPWTGNALG